MEQEVLHRLVLSSTEPVVSRSSPKCVVLGSWVALLAETFLAELFKLLAKWFRVMQAQS